MKVYAVIRDTDRPLGDLTIDIMDKGEWTLEHFGNNGYGDFDLFGVEVPDVSMVHVTPQEGLVITFYEGKFNKAIHYHDLGVATIIARYDRDDNLYELAINNFRSFKVLDDTI